ncbi:MAG: hypothetical protein GY913_22735 [Proteobacteria bacterium]|nr:hypothetical protein [Pseudomonadota bacterium]MCP4919727.1 hypothetical protein [Pseudomonadota bacterium]
MTTCGQCKQQMDPATGTFTEDGMICEDCQNQNVIDGVDDMAPLAELEGNFFLGFAAGFFGGCIGALLVLAMAKGTQTKKGARVGFGAQLVVGALLRVVASG